MSVTNEQVANALGWAETGGDAPDYLNDPVAHQALIAYMEALGWQLERYAGRQQYEGGRRFWRVAIYDGLLVSAGWSHASEFAATCEAFVKAAAAAERVAHRREPKP